MRCIDIIKYIYKLIINNPDFIFGHFCLIFYPFVFLYRWCVLRVYNVLHYFIYRNAKWIQGEDESYGRTYKIITDIKTGEKKIIYDDIILKFIHEGNLIIEAKFFVVVIIFSGCYCIGHLYHFRTRTGKGKIIFFFFFTICLYGSLVEICRLNYKVAILVYHIIILQSTTAIVKEVVDYQEVWGSKPRVKNMRIYLEKNIASLQQDLKEVSRFEHATIAALNFNERSRSQYENISACKKYLSDYEDALTALTIESVQLKQAYIDGVLSTIVYPYKHA